MEIQGYRGPQLGDWVWVESRKCHAKITSWHPTRAGHVRIHPGSGNQAPWVASLDSLLIVAEGKYETTDGRVVDSQADLGAWRRFLAAIKPSTVTVGGSAEVDLAPLRIKKAWFVTISWSTDQVEDE